MDDGTMPRSSAAARTMYLAQPCVSPDLSADASTSLSMLARSFAASFALTLVPSTATLCPIALSKSVSSDMLHSLLDCSQSRDYTFLLISARAAARAVHTRETLLRSAHTNVPAPIEATRYLR